jgi:molybdopterin synthase sulfur carrier subunit
VIDVLFFASLRETLACERVALAETGPLTLSELIERLVIELGSHARDALTAESVRVAVNQTLVQGNVAVSAGDEVAFLPPVTGG